MIYLCYKILRSSVMNRKSKWNTEVVSRWIKENKPGYELIREYIPGSGNKITVRCENGHVSNPPWAKFQRPKYGCMQCFRDRTRLNYEQVEKIFNNAGFTLVSTIYINNSTPLECICSNGHHSYITLSNISTGQGCRKCFDERNAVNRMKTRDEVIHLLSESNVKLIGEYYGALRKIRVECKNGHIYESTLNKIISSRYNGCKQCYNNENKGANCFNWKGGITPENNKQRNSEQGINFRRLVFERDNYKCIVCGNNNHKLRAHHLYSFSKYKELRFDISNGVTLCSDCHDLGKSNSFHTLFGTKDNTKEQFNKYLLMRGLSLQL